MWVLGIFLCVSVLGGKCRFCHLSWCLWRFCLVLVAISGSICEEDFWGMVGA